ncbi:MAG: formyltetrahydrofolate deformylase [Sumerlaeia bacterium]
MSTSSASAAKTAVLRLNCPDRPGIVHAVSGFIAERGGNILTSQQHCEELGQRFFMRVHFDCSAATVTRHQVREDLAALAAKYEMDATLNFADERKRMAIMVSKADHCLYDLLLRHQYGELLVDVACVVSNHLDLEHVAGNFRVPFFYIPMAKEQKVEGEARQQEIFRQHHIDFLVMARYMQILSGEFCAFWKNRVINVHHGLLPAFKGAKPYHQAYARGVKLIGATAHYATEDLDDGPIIAQQALPVTHSHSVQDMIALGREAEKRALAEAVRAHAEDRILVYEDRTIVF